MSDQALVTGQLILALGLFAAMCAAYMAPWIIALVRKKRNATPILIVNLVFGWTMLGWVVCLAWAFSVDA